jgi:2,4-dienoyl-CoA reductase-like NADH-dependent reductase (Old Yellow Enzyme family)
MSHLFEPLKIRDVRFSNRIAVSPMCQYCGSDGFPNDWHFVHLASRAVGGAGLVFTEAVAVAPEGRITPQDLGMWSDRHAEHFDRIVRFMHEESCLAGIQLAHAGRKASARRPWDGVGHIPEPEGGWTIVVGPTTDAFAENFLAPKALTEPEIQQVVQSFGDAARRARDTGFDVLELHSAHGYLLHEFLSPLSNHRQDRYGGSFENRTRLVREVVEAVRRAWPERLPLFLRISSVDWFPGGWDIEQSIELARLVSPLGVDLIDCSSGGIAPGEPIPFGPGYQTALAERVRREAGILTGTVGMITSPFQADHIIRNGQADLVLLARELLRDPYWPLRAARELGYPAPWPVQYVRAAPPGTPARSLGDHNRQEGPLTVHDAVPSRR